MPNLSRREFIRLMSAGAAVATFPFQYCTEHSIQNDEHPNITASQISEHLTIIQGPVNGALVNRNNKVMAIYGDPRKSPAKVDMVLFTHSRRDVAWAGKHLIDDDVTVIVPAKERNYFEEVKQFWDDFNTARFHDYSQQSTKILIDSIKASRAVEGEDTITWEDLQFSVLDTPGYTRGSITYFTVIDKNRIAFTGDLIYGDGKLMDIYSLQDAIPEINVRGYHGYATRAGQVIKSLRSVLDKNPDILVPARGPIIKNPKSAISKLIERLQGIYRNYLSITALHWYFGDKYIRTCTDMVLGKDEVVNTIPTSNVLNDKPPNWIIPISNSRLLKSKGGSAFLIDCGSTKIINQVQQMLDKGEITKVEGIYITHYHDDHTDKAQLGSSKFDCPVYSCQELEDILTNPTAYCMPAMTSNPIYEIQSMPHGSTMKWHEFQFTFYYYPGQTIYHGGLFVQREENEKFFFIGDSFAPTGIDDYCLENRNLIHADSGYFYCLNMLKNIESDYLLINQHIVETFQFSTDQLKYIIKKYQERKELLSDLFPWDDPNYGIDERWARIYPYGIKTRSGAEVELKVRILNHSNRTRTFQITPNPPSGWETARFDSQITIPARGEKAARVTLKPATSSPPGVYVFTVDLKTDEWELRRWTEGLIRVI